MQLVKLRGKYIPAQGVNPICAICDQPILDDPDMHEALITRADVEKMKDKDWIMHRCNCVLLHHSCHMKIIGHGGDEWFKKCAIHLVEVEGIDSVVDWFMTMAETKGSVLIVYDVWTRFIGAISNA